MDGKTDSLEGKRKMETKQSNTGATIFLFAFQYNLPLILEDYWFRGKRTLIQFNYSVTSPLQLSIAREMDC